MSIEQAPLNAVIIEQPVYFAPVPADGYDVLVQTITVLGDDGYPVGVQRIPLEDVMHHDQVTHNPLHGSRHRTAQFAVYSEWLEPLAEKEFSRFVTAGPAFPEAVEYKNLAWHPALHLNRAVSDGDPHAVREYEKAILQGKKSGLEGKVDLEALLVRCFATAMERRKCAGIGAPEPLVTEADMRAFAELGKKRPAFITVGVLQALVADYYAHVEQITPDMRHYRQKIPAARTVKD